MLEKCQEAGRDLHKLYLRLLLFSLSSTYCQQYHATHNCALQTPLGTTATITTIKLHNAINDVSTGTLLCWARGGSDSRWEQHQSKSHTTSTHRINRPINTQTNANAALNPCSGQRQIISAETSIRFLYLPYGDPNKPIYVCVWEEVGLCLALPFLLFRNAMLMSKSDSGKHSVKAWPPRTRLPDPGLLNTHTNLLLTKHIHDFPSGL